jgi:hypothetical protein
LGRVCSGTLDDDGSMSVGDVKELGMVESSVEVLSYFRRGLAESSGELKPRLRW